MSNFVKFTYTSFTEKKKIKRSKNKWNEMKLIIDLKILHKYRTPKIKKFWITYAYVYMNNY